MRKHTSEQCVGLDPFLVIEEDEVGFESVENERDGDGEDDGRFNYLSGWRLHAITSGYAMSHQTSSTRGPLTNLRQRQQTQPGPLPRQL